MSRLPTPGGDDGTWGNVLNDFLAVAHNPSGTIKTTLDAIPTATDNIDVNFHRIVNVTAPVSGQDVANKSYVDSQVTSTSRVISTHTLAYTADPTKDENILVDATAASVTITLPSAIGNTHEYSINKKDASTNSVVIATVGGQTINGSATVPIVVRYVSITVFGDGSNWYIK